MWPLYLILSLYILTQEPFLSWNFPCRRIWARDVMPGCSCKFWQCHHDLQQWGQENINCFTITLSKQSSTSGNSSKTSTKRMRIVKCVFMTFMYTFGTATDCLQPKPSRKLCNCLFHSLDAFYNPYKAFSMGKPGPLFISLQIFPADWYIYFLLKWCVYNCHFFINKTLLPIGKNCKFKH